VKLPSNLARKWRGLTYVGAKDVKGSLLIIDTKKPLGYDEVVRVTAPDDEPRLGIVLESGRDYAVIQVIGREEGLEAEHTYVNLTGSTFKIRVSGEVIGRIFNGRYEPIDGLPRVLSGEYYDVNGYPINPYAREYPEEFIQTGISIIDVMYSLIRGQKLPIFSQSGLPHDVIAGQIARQATVLKEAESFAIVFAGIGLRTSEAEFFLEEFRRSGALERSVLILNLAKDPAAERLLTPRIALTIGEYLAFEEGMHVLAILIDMTNYCEALREISNARGEVPGRGGYPGYLYSDLASIYERAGIIQGRKGSLTLMPILTMPGGDLRHPIPDTTGYITEGQIILSSELNSRGIYPPIDVLASLSRLMRSGVGEGKTRADHRYVADQLYEAYARGVRARDMASIVGEVGLSSRMKTYLRFTDVFEEKFMNQGRKEERSIDESLDLAWEVLSTLPEDELIRIPRNLMERYHPKYRVGKRA